MRVRRHCFKQMRKIRLIVGPNQSERTTSVTRAQARKIPKRKGQRFRVVFRFNCRIAHQPS